MSSGAARHIASEDVHPSALRHDEAEERLDEGALAGAVRPEQADRAGWKRGRDVLQRGVSPVDDGHLFEGDDRGGRRYQPFRPIYGRRLKGPPDKACLRPLTGTPQAERIGLFAQ